MRGEKKKKNKEGSLHQYKQDSRTLRFKAFKEASEEQSLGHLLKFRGCSSPIREDEDEKVFNVLFNTFSFLD